MIEIHYEIRYAHLAINSPITAPRLLQVRHLRMDPGYAPASIILSLFAAFYQVLPSSGYGNADVYQFGRKVEVIFGYQYIAGQIPPFSFPITFLLLIKSKPSALQDQL